MAQDLQIQQALEVVALVVIEETGQADRKANIFYHTKPTLLTSPNLGACSAGAVLSQLSLPADRRAL